jgi:cell division protein FtsB
VHKDKKEKRKKKKEKKKKRKKGLSLFLSFLLSLFTPPSFFCFSFLGF